MSTRENIRLIARTPLNNCCISISKDNFDFVNNAYSDEMLHSRILRHFIFTKSTCLKGFQSTKG